MKKTILLGTKESISATVSKWMFGILGLIWLGMGGLKLYEDGASVSSIGYLVIGLGFLINGIVIFTSNPFAPKVRITDSEIMIKKKVFGSAKRLLWSDITSIVFDQYQISFHLDNQVEEFNYDSNPETSLEIKSSIREVAETKDIQISDG